MVGAQKALAREGERVHRHTDQDRAARMGETLCHGRDLTQDLPVALALDLVGPGKAGAGPGEDILAEIWLLLEVEGPWVL
jgi:hypothetical protein